MKKAAITVHPDYPVGEISPRLFGAFLEPIGAMVNGSMFNPKHPTADDQGMRQDFIRALREAGLQSRLILQVHDERCPEGYARTSEGTEGPGRALPGRQLRLRLAVEGFHRSDSAAEGAPGPGLVSVYHQ